MLKQIVEVVTNEVEKREHLHEQIHGEEPPSVDWKVPWPPLLAMLLVAFFITEAFDGREKWVGYVLAGFFLLFFYAILILARRLQRLPPSQELEKELYNKVHGAKGWASNEQVSNALKNAQKGIYIGGGHYWDDMGHILTVGGSRSGKGSNLILNNLLSDKFTDTGASLIVLDPKGENLDVAGDYLKSCGYQVYCINPFNVKAVERFGNARFNPLTLTDVTKASRLCDMMAAAMLPPSGGKDSHFEESGSQYLSNYMLHMITKYPDDLSFEKLYLWVRYAGEKRLKLLFEMAENDASRSVAANAMAISDQIADGGNEINSIYSTMRRGTEFLKEDGILYTLSGNDIDFRQIPFSKTAIFLCMEPTELEDYKEFVRLFFATLMNTIPKVTDKKRKILMLMDEFAQMGRLREFEVGYDVLAGYNVTIWSIIQYMGQLESIYGGRYEGFIGSSTVKQFLGIGDLKTADYLDKTMPKELHFWEGKDGQLSHASRSMLSSNDVIYFDNIVCQIRAQGMDRPAKFPFMPYYKDPVMAERATKS